MAPRSQPRAGYILNNDLSWKVDGKEVSAKKGETRADIPEESLPWLLEQEIIAPVQPAEQTSVTNGENKES